MPKEKKEKKIVKKGKKKRKNKKSSERWKKYKIKETTIIREKFCPRCGPGIFLAKHQNRLFCGKCHYTEYITKSSF